MKKTLVTAVLGLSMVLASCGGPSAADRCMDAQNPKECFAVANAGGDVSDYLLYGMAGYMLSSAINGSGQRQTVIVQDPNYHGYRRPIQSYASSRQRVLSGQVHTVQTTMTSRPSLFGGAKTTTTTRTTYRSSPSYSSYRSSTPSYSSYRSSTPSYSSYRSSSFSSRR